MIQKIFFLLMFVSAYVSADGFLDPSFSGNGKISTPVTANSDFSKDIAVQKDGKIVAAGNTSNLDFVVVRYNYNGSLDPSFGAGGIVITDVSQFDLGTGVAIQSDGKIVVGGHVWFGTGADQFALLRYNSDGSLDSTFDGDGIVITPAGAQILDIQLQPDDKIVAAGFAATGATGDSADFAVARYNPDGSLDATFGGTGLVTYDFFPLVSSTEVAWSMALQPDGKIVAAGESDITSGLATDIALVRFNTDGSLDATFGTGGQIVRDLGSDYDSIRALLVQPDGYIVGCGTFIGSGGGGYTFDVNLVRYSPGGTPDPNFGTNGVAMPSMPNSNDLCEALLLLPDGSLMASGFYETLFQGDFGIFKFLSNGNLDPAFGSGGLLTADFHTSDDESQAFALQSDGKILVTGGSGSNVTQDDFGTARIIDGVQTFLDNLNDEDFSDWTVVKGHWIANTGALRTTTPKGQIHPPISFLDCSTCNFEFDVRINDDSARPSFLSFYQGPQDYVELLLLADKDKILLRRKQGGVVVAKKRINTPLVAGTKYHLHLQNNDSQLKVYLNGVPILSMNLVATPQDTTLGFRSKSSLHLPATAGFDNVLVYE